MFTDMTVFSLQPVPSVQLFDRLVVIGFAPTSRRSPGALGGRKRHSPALIYAALRSAQRSSSWQRVRRCPPCRALVRCPPLGAGKAARPLLGAAAVTGAGPGRCVCGEGREAYPDQGPRHRSVPQPPAACCPLVLLPSCPPVLRPGRSEEIQTTGEDRKTRRETGDIHSDSILIRREMAEISSPVNIKEKINAIRSVVPNKSNNEIVLVLQQFDNNVDKAVQAFIDGSATQVLKEWNMTGKKKNNRRKRSKSKQHPGNKDAKNKNDGPEKASQEPQRMPGCHLNGCSKDNRCDDSANEKLEATSLDNKRSQFVASAPGCPETTVQEREHQRVSVELSPATVNGVEQHEPLQSSVQFQGNLGRPKSKSSSVKSSNATSQLETKTDDSVKKRGPNIEKSVKDLQRCTVSLTRYRMMIKEEVDNSVKKIKAAFAELHSCIIDKEVSLMAEIDKVKEEAMEILTARQKKAEELKRLTDLASQMAEAQLSELRAEIKHFVSERKYDEELGRSARFSCDMEQLKTQIQLCGEISHPKNNYSSRTPCSSVLTSLTSHATTGKQNTHTRKSSSNAKNSNKTSSTKVQSHHSSNPTESSPQGTPTNKQNGPSNQRRRFNPQHQNVRLNGSLKPQGATNEADQNNVKSSSRSEHRRQQHNNFRPKNKGAMKNQEQSATARTTENVTHPEKSRRKHHTADTTDHRPFRGSVGRVSQCNLCPARMEVSADTTVLSVPAVTLVA